MRRQASRIRAFALVVGAACLGACAGTAEPEPQSPFGSDSTLYGEWDVNHAVPSSDVCAVAGITEVDVVFYRPSEPDVGLTNPALRFPCADGYYDSTGLRMMRAGEWQYRWRAYAGDTVVLQSALYTANVVRGGDLELHPVDFVRLAPIDLDIALRWATDTGFGTCAEAFAETMSWELRVGSSTGAVEASSVGSATCANAIALHGYSQSALSSGLHTLVIHGAATDGATWSAECSVSVPEGGPASASCDVVRAP